MDTDDINVPDKILAAVNADKRKRPRGYPVQLDDDDLLDVRQHLRWLLETTWDQVGSLLPTVRTMAQLQHALKGWEKRVEQEEYVIKALLRSSERPADSRLLYRQRLERGKLHIRYLNSYEWINKCWDSLERFLVIPAEHFTAGEQEVICDAIRVRAQTLARAGEDCIALRDQEKAMDDLIRDGEANFSRTEFLRFCRSKRYRLTPFNVANALAGLPFIGCRHSGKRCRKWPEDSSGLSYGIFRILQRIVRANVRRADLSRDTEKWLRSRRPGRERFAIADLRENWYYLRRSISAVLEQSTSRAQLPAAISREYWQRKSTPSAIDRAFAEEERIVM